MSRSMLAPVSGRQAIHGSVAVASVVVLAGAVLVARAAGVPFSTISRDTFITAEVSTSTGLLSNVGVIIWSGAGCVALFAASVVQATGRGRRVALALLWGGLLSGLLAADDLFMLHENGYSIGLPERGIYGAYVLALVSYLVVFRSELRHHPAFAPNVWLLAVALSFFAGSAVVDLLQEPVESLIGSGRIFLEDGCKFLGIAWWSAYFVTCAFDAIAGSGGMPTTLNRPGPAPAGARGR